MQDFLHATLNTYTVVPAAVSNDVRPRLKRLTPQRGTLLLTEGEVCRHLYFVERGFARGYYFEEGQRERTSWFWSEGDLLVSYRSFIEQTPTIETVELLEDAVLWRLAYADLEALYDRHPVLNVVARKMAEQAFFRAGELAHLLRSSSSRGAYEALVSRYPELLSRAYLKHISSYLGVSQETISRVRAASRAGKESLSGKGEKLK